MTKEELAKKKGIKAKETSQTAAELLITSTNKQTDKKESDQNSVKIAKKTSESKASEKKATISKNAESSKIGRPKGKPSAKLSINVPKEYIDMINVASGVNFKGNTSSYIVSLIEKDIRENGELYQKIISMVK